MPRLSRSVRAELRLFAFYLANGTIDAALLGDDQPYDALLLEPSTLEQIFALLSNVLEIDEQGEVLNAANAHRRVAQWIRARIDPSYVAAPPFEAWELELHL
jgi:hypothetical protein